jgi:quercetin dioxygenase-like cupin family protein
MASRRPTGMTAIVPTRRFYILTIILALGTVLQAQAPVAPPLPSNYKSIFENSDVLVMHVHYGAHEFVPMHDHPSVSTLYVYLNDSGEVDIIHEGPDATTAHRPPTHTGAFRIAPGLAERHSVQSNSDTDSDFLRVELKRIALLDLPETGKHVPAPVTPVPGVHTDYQDASIRIDRIICPSDKPCAPTDSSLRALLIPITSLNIQNDGRSRTLQSGQVVWFPAGNPTTLSAGSQSLFVSFFTHE